MAIVAAELWMTAVRSVAATAIFTTPPICCALMVVKMCAKSGFCLMGATPFDMK